MATRDVRAARRYAAALFQAVQKEGALEVVERELEELLTTLHNTPVLKEFWHSPLVPAPKKSSLIEKTFANRLHPLTIGFLNLLVNKRREELLEYIYTDFRRLVDRARHLLRAEAVFAVPPTPEEEQALRESLEKRTGANVELRVRLDPEILGGVVIRLQDTILDGSVRGSLERLRERFLQKA
ncbi:ATP synthase F1 subcomplex delta subunit [Chthonomonas calidirosea]|uniref:ATP synthase F1 subunit delta n=1 Tax=Chthonomonas calidirosea TaxID=454171 RepID=UPI0006DD3DCF|nr:ATP synthase F1 subunit delta [Chthonomonas calidirosea]CEK13839.1 ATP synthase F1 subcomplex delta subunit [Chthonomonas calidirosea]